MKKFKFFFLPVLLLFLLTSCTIKPPDQPDNLIYGEVLRVIDGDTFIFQENGTEMKMRLIGVDAPESVHPDEEKNTEEGVLSSAYTKEALEGKTVGIEFDVQMKDSYDRYLVYVWIDEELFNKRILEDGYAALMTVPPNVKYVDYLKRGEK